MGKKEGKIIALLKDKMKQSKVLKRKQLGVQLHASLEVFLHQPIPVETIKIIKSVQ